MIQEQSSWISSPDGSGWARPAFTPSCAPERQIRWRTTGTLILLHMLTLGNGPDPISPFLVYLLLAAASLQGQRSLCNEDTLIGLKTLYLLDSDIADTMRPWMVLRETDKISDFKGGRVPHELNPIRSLLNQFEFQVFIVPHFARLLF